MSRNGETKKGLDPVRHSIGSSSILPPNRSANHMNMNDGDELHGIIHSACQSSFGETKSKSKSKSNCNHSRIIWILAFFGVLHLAKGFIPSTNQVLTQRLIVESCDGFVPKFGADTSSNHRCCNFNFQASHEAQASCGTTISGESPKQEPASQIREPDVFCVGVITKQKSGSRIEERYVDTSLAH